MDKGKPWKPGVEAFYVCTKSWKIRYFYILDESPLEMYTTYVYIYFIYAI